MTASGRLAARAQDATEPPLMPAPTAGPSARDRVTRVTGAFQVVAQRASEGSWQRADSAYNEALDVLDANRNALEALVGGEADAALREVDGRLGELDAALAAEDAGRVQAVVGLIRAILARLAPELAAGTPALPAGAAEAVVAWRSGLDDALAFGRSKAWRDMRNSAMDLAADVEDRGPKVIAAAGPDSVRYVDRMRIMVNRVRGAALAESLDDGQAVAELAREAADALLVQLAVLPGPTPTGSPDARMVFRAYKVPGQVGETVEVPIVVENVPQIGLGGFSLSAHWSPSTLRLVGVRWDSALGEGGQTRDDVAGTVVLQLPQAPRGPSGRAIVATLTFEIQSAEIDVHTYLPAAEIDGLETTIAGALEGVRLGNLPTAATLLTSEFVSYLGGRTRPGSLYAELARHDASRPLEDALQHALDLTSQPAATDQIVLALGAVSQALEAAQTLYMARLGSQPGVPITLAVEEATDTTGAPLPSLEPVAGLILLDKVSLILSTPVAALTTTLGAAVGQPTQVDALAGLTESMAAALPTVALRPPATLVTAAMPTESPAPSLPDLRGGTFPFPLVVALLAAGFLGVLAVLLAGRQGDAR